jgi:hypothetical protein
MNIKSDGAIPKEVEKKKNSNNVLNVIVMILAVGLMIFAAASTMVTGFVALFLFIMGWWTAEDRYNAVFKKDN